MWFILLACLSSFNLCTAASVTEDSNPEQQQEEDTSIQALANAMLENNGDRETVEKIYNLKKEDDVLDYFILEFQKDPENLSYKSCISDLTIGCYNCIYILKKKDQLNSMPEEDREKYLDDIWDRLSKMRELGMLVDYFNFLTMITQVNIDDNIKFKYIDLLRDYFISMMDENWTSTKGSFNHIFSSNVPLKYIRDLLLEYLARVEGRTNKPYNPYFFSYYMNQIKNIKKDDELNGLYKKVFDAIEFNFNRPYTVNFLINLDNLEWDEKIVDKNKIYDVINKADINTVFDYFHQEIKENNKNEQKIAKALKYVLNIENIKNSVNRYFSSLPQASGDIEVYYSIAKFIVRAGLADDDFFSAFTKHNNMHMLRFIMMSETITDFIGECDDKYKEKITKMHLMFKSTNNNDSDNIDEQLSSIIDCFKLFDDRNDDPKILKKQNILPAHIYTSLKMRGVFNNIYIKLNSEKSIADYFSLVALQKDQAYNKARDYLLGKGLQKNLQTIKDRIDDNFSSGYLKMMSENYEEKNWQGNRTYNKTYTNDYNYTLKMQSAELQTKYGMKKYVFYPAEGETETIVVSLYGGHTNNSCTRDSIAKPLKKGIMVATIELGDCESDVFQADQLTPQRFQKTHPQYIRVAAEFINELKVKYPNAKIILKGDSFGGFFIMSYAYLEQFQNTDFNTYYPWVKDAFKQEFLDGFRLAKIDGIAIHDGSIDYMQKILKDENSLYDLRTPMFIHQNFNDERVPLYRIRKTLEKLNPQYLKFVLSRDGAKPFMQEETTEESLENIRSGYSIINLRGHFDNYYSQNEYNAELLNFIDMINEKQFKGHLSDFGLIQTKRRLKIALTADKDVQQFLSNLRDIQNDPNKDIPHVQAALKNIKIPENMTEQEAYDILMKNVSTKELWKSAVKTQKFKNRIKDDSKVATLE